MSDNKTSQAVEMMRLSVSLASDMEKAEMAIAIAKKYQKMEETLMIISRKGKVTHYYEDGETEKLSTEDVAKGALAFDPLSEDER